MLTVHRSPGARSNYFRCAAALILAALPSNSEIFLFVSSGVKEHRGNLERMSQIVQLRGERYEERPRNDG